MANVITACGQQTKDPVKKANESNEIKSDKNLVDEEVAEFFVKSADARMMGIKEGKLARDKGTTTAIKEYGALMIKDQSILLTAIRELAAKRNISLPEDISGKKEDGREDLSEKSGEDFDEKFIKMMTIDHQRDLKMFKKATEFKDDEVKLFAQNNLELIQSHLDKIKALENSRK